jgi:hypothetical protein
MKLKYSEQISASARYFVHSAEAVPMTLLKVGKKKKVFLSHAT